MAEKRIHIRTTTSGYEYPITARIIAQATQLLNIAFNIPEFKKQLADRSFVATNKPELSSEGEEIKGKDVFKDIMSYQEINVCVSVKKLGNLWKRWISKTMGETKPSGSCIVTYNWWLKSKKGKELVINYAAHLGHEIMHTNYYGYVHHPKMGSASFNKEKDVTYVIDDILEELIRKNYNY